MDDGGVQCLCLWLCIPLEEPLVPFRTQGMQLSRQEALLFALQQHGGTAEAARMNAAKVQCFKKGDGKIHSSTG